MHRIPTLHGYRQSKSLRILRAIAYSMICVAGGLLLASGLLRDAYGPLAVWMAWFLVVGGLLGAVGTSTLRWVGEFTGLPLLVPAFAVLGFITWDAGFETTPYIATANGLLLTALAVILMARWRFVLAIFRIADKVARHE